ncbi:glucuronosyltransferase [Novosphingobium aquimarinum]|uniref:glucuronosyltransferase n=1 Tax=Novosphingobium aquimarinum TaxID=2682494 RepID=UPI0038CD2B5F
MLRPAFEGANTTFACTDPLQKQSCGDANFFSIADYSRSSPVDVARGVFELYRIIDNVKPDVVISTGAAPGLIALFWGRLLGAKTIWIDSIANSQRLSFSGFLAKKFSHTTLTQWEHLSDSNRCQYWGSVI